MYVVVLASSGSHVLLPEAVAMREDQDGVAIHFIDAQGKTVATFHRPDVTVHGFENDLPPEDNGEA